MRSLPGRADLYDDAQASTLREICLTFHDVRAAVVEIAARADALRNLAAAEAWRRQLAALEALQARPWARRAEAGSVRLHVSAPKALVCAP